MVYQELGLPQDIPWKRLAGSADMMDTRSGDFSFPPKWRSSISIFYHEPSELPETYCDRSVTYLKVVCSITGYQVGRESGSSPDPQGAWKEETIPLTEEYHACYGAMLQVAVFPRADSNRVIPLSDFPYIADFEPKQRELYEAVTKSGEILGRSLSNLNLRKSGTNAETTSYSSKIGAEVKAQIKVVDASISAEHSWGGGTHVQEENTKTTDDSREKRETYGASTNLTQMYEIFTGYHMGTNRAVFYMLPRPHMVEDKDQYTFTNGPRRLEGIQEVFLVINRPKSITGICVDAFLETAHLFGENVEPQQASGGGVTAQPDVAWEPMEAVVGMSGEWPSPHGEPGQTKDFTQNLLTLGAGCELDVTRGGDSWMTGEWDDQASLLISVPQGFWFDFQSGTFWRSLHSIEAGVSGNQVSGTVRLRGMSRNFPEKFNAQVHIYYRCPKSVEPTTAGAPPPPPPLNEKHLFLTSRGISACTSLQDQEESGPALHQAVNWPVILKEDQREVLFDWLQRGVVDSDPGRAAELQQMIEQQSAELQRQIRDTVNFGDAQVPGQWLLPDESITFETPIPHDARLGDESVPAIVRIRLANALSSQIGTRMLESLGSIRRYPRGAVDFWHSDMAMEHLVRQIGPGDELASTPVANLDVPYRAELLEMFGEDVQRSELGVMDVGALESGLGITAMEARRLKLQLLVAPAVRRERSNDYR